MAEEEAMVEEERVLDPVAVLLRDPVDAVDKTS